MTRRPKADAREALGAAFAHDLWASWRDHGAEAIEAVRKDKPDLYVKLVTAMLPRETTGLKAADPDDLDDAALDRRISALASALGLAIGAREGAGSKGKAAARTRLERYRPYTKQIEFHAAGAAARERLLMAGNQLGKTYCGAAEAAIHLTGLYPDWWAGRRFDRPVRAWAGSKTGEVTRDGVQRLLVGEPKDKAQWGAGMIPGARLLAWSARSSTPGALDGLTVRHASGGTSTLGFKSYADRARKSPA